MPTMPHRSEDLARPRSRKGQQGYEVTTGRSGTVTIPEPDPDWCSTATMVWESALVSGGAAFYESSDYAVLHLICDQIDHLYQQGGRRSPEYLRVIMQSLGNLLATEGDRRRLRIELERGTEDESDVLASVTRLFENQS